MKRIYIITYELNSKGDYDDLYDAIKAYGTWWHHVESTWIIVTEQSASEINNNLKKHINKGEDNLIIIKLDITDRAGWLPKKAWAWFKKRK